MSTTALSLPKGGSRGLLLKAARSFYQKHSDLIKESHGILHAEKVYQHACKAIESLSSSTTTTSAPVASSGATSINRRTALSQEEVLEIEAAALLHDVDDEKYFPKTLSTEKDSIDSKEEDARLENYALLYPNALELMKEAKIPESSHETILFMIDAVSCSKNGNSVPTRVDDNYRGGNFNPTNTNSNTNYHLLIPRWSDRIEAVGARGVWRCYQYNQEKKRPLDLPGVTPRPQTKEELWSYVVPERFETYMKTPDGQTKDPSMLGHYYDKLFHVACPPKEIVRNDYLEDKLQDSAKELVEVCLRYGKTGVVDEDYIQSFRDK